jgi:plastocyanin
MAAAVPVAIKKVIIPPNFANEDLEVNYFIPRFVKVLKGQEVEWVNLDNTCHHLEFYNFSHDEINPLFDLDPIEPKESGIKRFDLDLQRIDYVCTKHKNEIGTIVIYRKPEEQMTNKEQLELLNKILL